MKELPKWIKFEAEDYANRLHPKGGKYFHSAFHAFEAGARAVLDRVEGTKAKDYQSTETIKRFIEKRRAVESAATPGPWIVAHCDYAPGGFNDDILIADARNSLPALLKAVEEMAGVLSKFESYIPREGAGALEQSVNEAYKLESSRALSRAAEIVGEKE